MFVVERNVVFCFVVVLGLKCFDLVNFIIFYFLCFLDFVWFIGLLDMIWILILSFLDCEFI